MKKLLKAIYADIYIRLSSKPQENGMSKETQEKECRKYCKEHGILVRNIYYENKSGMTPYNRPVFYEMIAKQQSKDRADVIISFCLNRLTRNQNDFYPIRVLVDEFDTKIVFVKENIMIEKPFKAHEKFLTSILIAAAEFEVNHMNEIRKRGLLEKALTGVRPSRLNYGYGKFKGRIIVKPKEALFVKQAFKLYATGMYSLKTLPDKLYEMGYIYKSNVVKIPRATLASMLKSLFYTGKYYFPEHNEVIKGKHKALIDDELFKEVQKVMEKPSSKNENFHEFLYSKLISYKDNGSVMSGELKKGKYIYYKAFDDMKNCYCYVNEVKITEYLLERLKLIRIERIPKDLIDEVFKEKLHPLNQQLKALKRKVPNKKNEELILEKYIEDNGTDDTDIIEDLYSEIEEKYRDLPDKIKITEDKIAFMKSKYQDILQMNLAEIFNLLDLSNKRKILELIINKFEIDSNKKIKVTFKSTFRKLIQRKFY